MEAGGQVSVKVDALSEDDESSTKQPYTSIEEYEESVKSMAPESAPLVADLARWWEDEQEGYIRFNPRSLVLLLADHGPMAGKAASAAILWDNGDVEYPNLSLARRVGLASEEALDARAREHGFVGVKRLNRPNQLLLQEDLESVRALIEWTADELRRHKLERDALIETYGGEN